MPFKLMSSPIYTSLIAVGAAVQLAAQSNIDPEQSIAVSAEIGRITFLPQESSGARINQFHAAGYLYGENIGWITLGSGAPANGLHYQNNSASDFGVNVLASGALRGYAYGANIGWISFEPLGNPRVDWATGQLHGAIYAANTGWIYLEAEEFSVAIESLAPAPDSDADGLPDAWEIQHAEDLITFSGESDSDLDGQLDLDEYRAGTDPLDPSEFLWVSLEMSPGFSQTIEWPTKYGHTYQLEERGTLSQEDGWTPVTESPVFGSGDLVSLTLEGSGEGAQFFRIAAFPPLSAEQ